MKPTLSNPAMFLFSAKNSAGDSAYNKRKTIIPDKQIYKYLERERERLTLLENAFLRFSGGLGFAFLRLRWALTASAGLHGYATKNFS